MRIFTLTIDCDNAAFDNMDAELPAALRDIAARIEIQSASSFTVYRGEHARAPSWPVRDTNGNTVGSFRILDMAKRGEL